MSTLKVGNISNVGGTKSSTTDVMIDSLVTGGIVIGMPMSMNAATNGGANNMIATRYMCRKTQYITQIGFSAYLVTNNAKLKFAIYSGDSAPTTLLAQTAEITVTTAAQNDNDSIGTLITPIIVTRGTLYWLVWLSDGAHTVYTLDQRGSSLFGVYLARTYASGFPDPFGGGLTAYYKHAIFAL